MVFVGGPDELIEYNYSTETIGGYPSERIAPGKRQMVRDSPVMPVLPTTLAAILKLYVTRLTVFDLQREYRRNACAVDDDGGLQSEVLLSFVIVFDDMSAQGELEGTAGGSTFSAYDRLVIATALRWLSKTAPTSGCNVSHLLWSFVGLTHSCPAASNMVKRKVEL